MAQSCFRLRRALTSLAALRRPASSSVATLSAPPLLKLSSSISHLQSRPFRSSATISLSSNKTYHLYKEGDEITPDTILFEGCDYNHWLITMDFPRDPNLKPPPDEMVRIYEKTCAQGLNISLEEAKKRIYACSTTTYEGFQAIMTEEESKKFESLPGVVFVLPDSYIDPVNKEYGGDKYENGVITHRPPPVYHNTGGRFRDQNRRSSRPRNTWQEDAVQNQQGGPIQGDGRNYRAPQNVPSQQNYPPRPNYQPQQNHPMQQNVVHPGQGERWGPMPVNNTDNARGGREFYQADRSGPMPSYQGSYNQGQQGNGYPSQADQRGCGQNNFASGNMNYTPPSPGGTYGQGMGSNYGQSWQGTSQGFSQMGRGNGEGDSRNYEPMGQTSTNQGSYNQGQQGNGYPSQADQRGYGQNNFASGNNNMNYTPPSPGGTYGQGMGSNYGQSWQGTSQGFSQMGHGNGEGGSRNYEPMGQTSTNQGRY